LSDSFTVRESGERIEGLAKGIDRAHLDRLKRGKTPVEREIDLHGLTRSEAGLEIRAQLQEAFELAERCILIIHGRGARTETGPVLKEALLGWLREPPLDRLVMAFASALPEHGGTGATYVLLRRKRQARRGGAEPGA
jgi:DNA-nicking Smr family endonuclease